MKTGKNKNHHAKPFFNDGYIKINIIATLFYSTCKNPFAMYQNQL